MGVALAAVAAVILVAAVGRPRIPWLIRDLASATVRGDPPNGGVKHRHELLRRHPFPAALAPAGYRLTSFEPIWDGEENLGWDVYFPGPDEQDSISYYTHAMAAGAVYEHWKNATTGFAKAEGKRPMFLRVEDLGSRSFCAADETILDAKHRVSCIAAFDGMAVIAETINTSPESSSLKHAETLLRAGVAHWESIGD